MSSENGLTPEKKDLGKAVVIWNQGLPIPIGTEVKVVAKASRYDVYFAEQLAETLTDFLTVEYNGRLYEKRLQSFFAY